jgi:hypothetical protein
MNPKLYALQVRKIAREFASSHDWNPNAALDLAHAVLEEVNWHTLAITLLNAAETELQDESDLEEQAERLSQNL